MRGTVKIGGTEVDMLANGASPFIYKRIFHKDFFNAMGTPDKVDIDTITEMGFVMHMQTVKTFKEILDTVKIDDFYEWVTQFEALDLPMATNQIMALYYDQQRTTVRQKKK